VHGPTNRLAVLVDLASHARDGVARLDGEECLELCFAALFEHRIIAQKSAIVKNLSLKIGFRSQRSTEVDKSPSAGKSAPNPQQLIETACYMQSAIYSNLLAYTLGHRPQMTAKRIFSTSNHCYSMTDYPSESSLVVNATQQ